MSNNRRIEWIDQCKGLAIILVVLGHTLRNDISLVYIYGFHMPLFFFLSGLVFNEEKYNLMGVLKSRINSLIIPYLLFYILTWLYWLLIERSFRPLGLEWWQPLLGMIQGSQAYDLMNHNGILWFLPCLFCIEVLFVCLYKLKNKLFRLVALLLVVVLGFNIIVILPWCLNIAMVSLLFFYCGNSIKSYVINDKSKSLLLFSVMALSLSLYIFIQYATRNHVNIATCQYGNKYVFLISSFLGIIVITCFCRFVTSIFNTGGGNCLNYLGRNTIVIFALHQPLLRIIRFIGEKAFKSFPVDTDLLVAIGVDIAIIVSLIPIICIYNYIRNNYLSKLYI